MVASDDAILQILIEIRDLLVPISVCFEEQYTEIQRQRLGVKLEELEQMLTPVRRKIYPLLFDSRRLSQVEIAKETNTTQPTVSRFIGMLLEGGFIEQTEDETGAVIFRDKFDLRRLMEL